MALVSGGRSTLNPNAPLFIPAAFRQVEDFSPEWWSLIKTSTWFHDYWLSQQQEEDTFGGNDDDAFYGNNIAALLPDTFDLGTDDFLEAQFEEFIQSSESEGNRSSYVSSKGMQENGLDMDAASMMKNLTLMKSPRERGSRYAINPVMYQEKPAKCISPKCSPRIIQQPR